MKFFSRTLRSLLVLDAPGVFELSSTSWPFSPKPISDFDSIGFSWSSSLPFLSPSTFPPAFLGLYNPLEDLGSRPPLSLLLESFPFLDFLSLSPFLTERSLNIGLWNEDGILYWSLSKLKSSLTNGALESLGFLICFSMLSNMGVK